MHDAEPQAGICPLCRIALRKRLGDYECPECGFVAQPEIPARRSAADAPSFTGGATTGGRLSFFDPARYIPPEEEASPGSLYFEKQLCFRIFVCFELLPVFGILLFGLFVALSQLGVVPGMEDVISGSTAMIMWIAVGLGVVLGGIGVAVRIMIMRWALFGTNALPKWGCLVLNGLGTLYAFYACIVMSMTGKVVGSEDTPLPGEWRGWAALLILLDVVYQGWLVYILQRDLIKS
jgi:hypothetical protein